MITKYIVKCIMNTPEGEFIWYFGKDSKLLGSTEPLNHCSVSKMTNSMIRKFGYNDRLSAENSKEYKNTNNSALPQIATIISIDV